MAPLWLKIVLLALAGVVTAGWWLVANFALMMSSTGTARLPLRLKVIGWVLMSIVGALMWWIIR